MMTPFELSVSAAATLLGLGIGLAIRRRTPASDDTLHRAIVERANEGILVADSESGGIIEANPTILRKLGYSRQEAMILRLDHILVENADDLQRHQPSTLARTAREIMQRCKDGSMLPVDVSVSILSANGKPALCYVVRDASTRRGREHELARKHSEAEQRAEYLAHHDELTGLPNRIALLKRLTEAINGGGATAVALLLVDLDDFSSINDAFGADAGDSILLEIGSRLQKQFIDQGIVARIGGDEFAILLASIAGPDAAARAAFDAQATLAPPFRRGRFEATITANIGIGACLPGSCDADTLFGQADMALSKARSQGSGNVQFFEHQINEDVHHRMIVLTDLRRALERDELVLHYQPIVEIATRKVLSLEALVRWQHPIRGMIPPAEFIPIAEQSGLIVQLGEKVIFNVCEQIMGWRNDGLSVVPIAINVSPEQFRLASISQFVHKALASTGIPADLIAVEVTESALMNDIERCTKELDTLRTDGIRILVDDFGTGYSSLSYLKHLPIDTLKIDRSFVSNVHINPADESIVSAIIAMARSLHLNVVAEGVESNSQVNVLARHGCQMAQGYYFGRPMPADDCAKLLRDLAQRPSFTDTLRLRLTDLRGHKSRTHATEAKGE